MINMHSTRRFAFMALNATATFSKAWSSYRSLCTSASAIFFLIRTNASLIQFSIYLQWWKQLLHNSPCTDRFVRLHATPHLEQYFSDFVTLFCSLVGWPLLLTVAAACECVKLTNLYDCRKIAGINTNVSTMCFMCRYTKHAKHEVLHIPKHHTHLVEHPVGVESKR